MKDETKKKIKKGALIALQVALGGFALFGMISTGALVKSCSKGEINTTAVVATTPVVGQRVKFGDSPDGPGGSGVTDLTYTEWLFVDWPSVNLSGSYNIDFEDGSGASYSSLALRMSGERINYGNVTAFNGTDSGWNNSDFKVIEISGGADVTNAALLSWLDSNAYYNGSTAPSGLFYTYDYAYCSPVGTLPEFIPLDYSSVTMQFQADTGYGFPDTDMEISGYTQIYQYGLEIENVTYGGYLGNGLYNAIEITAKRAQDATDAHISVSAIASEGFEYPNWKFLNVTGTHCSVYMNDSTFNADGVVYVQAFPDTGYYFDQEKAFIGNQLVEKFGAEVVTYDLSTGGLFLTVRKNADNLQIGKTPTLEITPLSGSTPVGGGDMGKAFDLFRDGFSALLPLFMVQVLPGITLGMLFMVPFIVILILFILKVVHK